MEVPIDFNSLSREVQKSDVKIIVFLNPCGHNILTTQFNENQRWIYEPSTSYRDDFFQTSMHILQNPSHSKNILLAKFEFDDLCYNSIRYISSQAIHNLPSDIKSLLQKVGHMQIPPKKFVTCFHEEYLKARSYCETKPRYGYINELMQIHTLVSTWTYNYFNRNFVPAMGNTIKLIGNYTTTENVKFSAKNLKKICCKFYKRLFLNFILFNNIQRY